MNLFHTIWLRLRSLGRRRAVKEEIDDELRFHVEQRVSENIAAGMSPEEAAREARNRFGNLQSVREECRDVRGAAFGETVLQDIRFGARLLRKNPGFTAVVLLTLALGTGSVSSVFSGVQGVLLKPFPYSKPERIVLINSVRKDGAPYANGCTETEWRAWRTEAKSFEDMAAYSLATDGDILISPDGNESVSTLDVTLDFFKVMGIQPQLGRAFVASDVPPSGESATVVILGHEFWQRQFHGDLNIIGKPVRFNFSHAGPLTVIGVMPPGFRGLPSPFVQSYEINNNTLVDCWLPVSVEGIRQVNRGVVGRLREGARLSTAQAELTAISARQAQEDTTLDGVTAKAELLPARMNSDGRRLLVPLSGAVLLVFVIACGNVAALLLARGLQRQQEYAVRCALGARRWRLFRQAFAESLILAFLGGVFGAGLAVAVVKVLKVVAGVAIPRLDAVTIGWPMLLFCFAATLLATVIAGLAPAVRASLLDPTTACKGGTRTSANRTDRRLLAGVVLAQTALTLVLLMGAGLMIRTVASLAQIRPGYETQRIVAMTVTELKQAQPAAVANDTSDLFLKHMIDFHERVMAQLPAVPGVKSAAWAFGIPLINRRLSAVVEPEGIATTGKFKDDIDVPVRLVSPGYFDTLGIQLLDGRDFGPVDSYTNRVFTAVINEVLARQCFPGSNPIGKKFRFKLPFNTAPFRDAEVIGVASNSRDEDLTQEPKPEFYLSYWQLPTPGKTLVVRAAGDPRSAMSGVLHVLRAADPTVDIEDVKTLEQIRDDSIAPQLFTMRLLTGFSILAAALALVGIYGGLSLSVASRRQEMAIRMAVGAQRQNIFGLIFGEGLKLVAAGLFIGVGVALASARILRALLFGVEPGDPLTFAAVAVLFMAVAALSCYFPARRATQIDPMEALRYE
jgi:putative ABC transport system permease protein